MRLQRLVRVYTCQNVKLLEISYGSSIFDFLMKVFHTLCIDWLWSVDDYTCFDRQYDHEVKGQGQIIIASGCNMNYII